MLLLPPVSVLAASRPPWTMAALLVAAVSPLSGQRWRRGFVLRGRLLQDGRRAQLRRLTERLGRLVVPRGGDLPDLAAAAQPRRRGDAHDGAKGGNSDLVLERAGVAFGPVVPL